MTRVILKRGNDQVVTLHGLKAVQSGLFLNEATVKATLQDSKNVAIPAFTNVPMVYVPSSDGTYEWTIEADTMMLPKSVEYSLVITAVQESLNYRVVHPVSVVDA
jgi:hypothetical protein